MKHLLSLAAAVLLAWGSQAQTTLNVDMTCAPEFDNVFVTGPWCGWCANDVYNTMTDPDGDGIYTVTLDETVTGLIEYKYAINGFDDQEQLVNDMNDGATCAPVTDYNTYANRQIQQGSVANDFYGTCDGTCNDAPPLPGGTVTFKVDMSNYTGSYNTVNLNGTFTNWCGSCAPMSDADGDMIYELDVPLDGGTVEYLFTLDGWTTKEEFEDGAQPCTSTIDGYVNRTLDVTGDVELSAVCWNECTVCNAEPVPGCTDPTACNFDVNATQDDGSCVNGDGPMPNLVTMDALCHDGMGTVMLDSAFVDTLGGTFMLDTLDLALGAASLVPGSYVLVATDSLGCGNDIEFTIGAPDTLTIAVTVVTLDSGAGDGQATHEVTGGTPDYTVVYSTFGVAANPDSLAQGLYTATVTDANNCQAAFSFTVEADQVAELATVEGSIFPVPVGDVLNVRLERPLAESAQIQVLDAQGRIVMAKVIRQGEQVLALDATSWSTGLYNIQLTTKGARASWSFVK